jgi:hypothetical protein
VVDDIVVYVRRLVIVTAQPVLRMDTVVTGVHMRTETPQTHVAALA